MRGRPGAALSAAVSELDEGRDPRRLVAKERAFIDDLRTRARALKQQGVTADEAGKQLSVEFKTKYPDWPNMNVSGFVRSIYAE